jgi:hypothetical protein
MLRPKILVMSSGLLLCCLAACTPPLKSLAPQRKALAESWGIKADDYGLYFPLDYFQAKLQSGASLDEVHAIIKDYKKAFHCGYDREIYYYYYTEDNRALRISVTYEPDGMILLGIVGEDWNEGGISTQGCEPGRFGDNP